MYMYVYIYTYIYTYIYIIGTLRQGVRGIPTTAEIEYLKKARGTIRAVARVTPASGRRRNNLKGFKDFYLKAKALNVFCVPYPRASRTTSSTTACRDGFSGRYHAGGSGARLVDRIPYVAASR